MMISAIAVPISGAGKAALKAGTNVYRAVAVEGGKVLITGAAGGKSAEYVYKQTGSRGLSILTGLGVGALSYGGLHGIDKAANISGVHGKTGITAVKGKGGAGDTFNFTNETNKHMNNTNRKVPVQTLKDVIEAGQAMPDPRGSSATMYYSTMYKNGKLYNIEVLYEKSTNTIYHFEYTRKAIGNLSAIPK